MKRWLGTLSGVTLFCAAALTVAHSPAITQTPLGPTSASPPVSVLTYNVHGLPWPFAFGREVAFDEIAERLRQLRAKGAQPHIVVLQEAFTAPAKRIGREAGYRYSAEGPSTLERDPDAAAAGYRRWRADESLLKGEGWGKAVDSGLMILSDYPILSVRRLAFPDFACAGYDCLANKGVLMAVVKVPGATPVAIVTTHLNSHAASGVGDQRSNAAYARQTEQLARFLRGSANPSYPIVLAGDFNVGDRPKRLRALLTHVDQAWTSAGYTAPKDALRYCMSKAPGCAGTRSPDARLALARARDWEFFAAGPGTAIRVSDIRVLFGRNDRGDMLSDHIGYQADYAVASGTPAGRSGVSTPAG